MTTLTGSPRYSGFDNWILYYERYSQSRCKTRASEISLPRPSVVIYQKYKLLKNEKKKMNSLNGVNRFTRHEPVNPVKV